MVLHLHRWETGGRVWSRSEGRKERVIYKAGIAISVLCMHSRESHMAVAAKVLPMQLHDVGAVLKPGSAAVQIQLPTFIDAEVKQQAGLLQP